MSCCRLLFSSATTFVSALLILSSLLASTSRAEDPGKPFEAKFWQFLIGNNYQNWAPGPDQDGDFYSGQVPHGALLKMYVNRSAASNVAGLKLGSIVVLENYRSDRSLKSISVMYRTEGFNPSANDWYWVEYNPDGTVVEEGGRTNPQPREAVPGASESTRLLGKANKCIACHGQAGGSDYAFFNDEGGSSVAGHRKARTQLLR